MNQEKNNINDDYENAKTRINKLINSCQNQHKVKLYKCI